MAKALSAKKAAVPVQSGKHSIDIRSRFEQMRAASRELPPPTYEERMERLGRLAAAIKERKEQMVAAVSSDFGNRSSRETKLAEVLMLLDGIKYIRKNLKGWMRPQKRHVSMTYKPARARVHFQPLGVVGIISPWNYPFQLAFSPTAAALAAGNRVMIKPSEYTPASSELVRTLSADVFEPDLVSVMTGGPEVGEEFSHLPFDHLLYTGSTSVGRLVMRAAADNLVPVTLELGGKSPAIVHDDYPVLKAAARITWGKWANSGQTCIAPDYLLVPEHKVADYVQALAACAAKSYPTLRDNPDYTSIVNDRHYQRVRRLIDDALKKGAKKTEVNPASETLPPESHKIAPVLLTDVTDDMLVMQEEIFGPVLPVKPYKSLDEAIQYVNQHPRPLALYYFDSDKERVAHVLERTVSGGAAVNETLLHFGIDDMPFGGVGPSGMGAYHGREGFETFSHKKSVLYQAKWNAAGLLAPPYGDRIDRMLKMLIG